MPETILYEVEDSIATITLNRPDQLNALNRTMIDELVAAFDETDGDDDVRAVVITGTGRAFCAGADMSGGEGTFRREGGDGTTVPRDGGGVLCLRIYRSLKPVIGAINGSAVGGGLTMTLPMDARFVSDRAKLGFVFGARGITLDGASSWFLPRVVGISQALEWVLTARMFTADEALSGGLVREVLPAEQVLDAARKLAKEIVANAAPLSTVFSRQLLWLMMGARHPMDAHRIESRAIRMLGRGADSAEGVGAFLEKRAPQWSGAPSRELPDWFPWEEEPAYEGPEAR